MGKLPAFQFYPGDWIQDTATLSLSARGAWIDLLCALWRSPIRGQLTLSIIEYGRLLRTTPLRARAVLDELIHRQICTSVTEGNGDVTVINRRMEREERERKSTRLRVKRFRNAESNGIGNGDVTVPSSSSKDSSSSSKLKAPPGAARLPPQTTDTAWMESLKANSTYQGLDVDLEWGKARMWCETNRRMCSRRFFVNWLNKAERPINGTTRPLAKWEQSLMRVRAADAERQAQDD